MNPSVFFCGEILALGERERKGCDFYNLLKKICTKLDIFCGKTILNCHIYTIGSCIKKIILLSLSCSQIWLSPLVEYCQFNYLTKLKKKKPTESSVSWPITQLEHLHQRSARHPAKNISPIQVLVTNFFPTPPIKLEPGL
jgi:hypothetical protein